VIPSHPDNKAQNGNINMRKKIHHSGAITVKIATIFLQPLVPCVARARRRFLRGQEPN